MPQCKDNRKARRKRLFGKISPSTFIYKMLGSNSSILDSGKSLHSKSTYFYRWGIPSICGLVLLVGGIMSVNPMMSASEKTFAKDSQLGSMSSVTLVADPVISLAITANEGNTNTNVVAGKVAYFSSNIKVTGANITKYYLTLSSPSGSSGNLVGKENPGAMVGKVNHDTTPADFGDNAWGYAVTSFTNAANDSLTYSPVPTGGDSTYLASRASAPDVEGDNYKLVFAAKINAGMPADHYQADVYVSVVANADVVVDLGLTDVLGRRITKMQEMTSDFCDNVRYETPGLLMDARDNKIYWVTRLADGNCWMTQNLDYDITIDDMPSVQEITDIATWKPSTDGGLVDNDTAAYYDPGDYYYNGVDGSHSSGAACTGATSLANCAGFSTFGDAHYHVGNYYSWDAATLGSKSGMAGGESYDEANNAPDSICPTGWQLPTSNNSDNKSFAALMDAYDLLAYPDTTDESVYTNDERVYGKPMHFVYAGLFNGVFTFSGGDGYYWSSTPGSNDAYAYFIAFGETYVDVAHIMAQRRTGNSVRCVAS